MRVPGAAQRRVAFIAPTLALAFPAFVTPSLAGDPAFVDRSSALGIEQRYEGEWTHVVGGGVAIFDCDGDRKPDLYMAGGSAPSRLYRNVTAKPGADIAFSASPFPELSEVTGAYPLDADGDGHVDLVVLRVGENQLMRGDGACHFSPAPPEWKFFGGDSWSTAFTATFENGQSWPTFVFGNYVDLKNPDGPFEACDANMVLRPDGRGFGAPIRLEPGFCALSMLISDWKRAGTPDLRVSNDRQYYVFNGREQMFHLDSLTEYGEAEGWPEMKLWGMGIASRDITGDGLPEVMLTSMADQNLMLNLGGGKMENAPYSIGTYAQAPYMGDDGRPSTGWHAEFGDIDNDGRDDLFIAKGNVDQMPSNAMHDPNNLLIQKRDGTFVEMGGVSGVGTTERSRGAGLADLNADGKLDIVVVNRRANAEIWQNATPNTGNWIEIEPRQEGPNTRAVGAIVELKIPDGTLKTQEITIGGGHVSGRDGPLHFGLGGAETADVRITWPGGAASDWVNVSANKLVRLKRGETGNGVSVEE